MIIILAAQKREKKNGAGRMVCWEDATGPRGDAAVPRVYVAIHNASPHAASLSFTPISACAEIRFNVVLSGRVFDHAPLAHHLSESRGSYWDILGTAKHIASGELCTVDQDQPWASALPDSTGI